ncbi:MAG TPA: hypothetical protein VN717_10235, partial [Gemmatimonadaceae bacterium]|nr:hypothetical protein [Gemmatimonadaceae bacterium]
MASAGRVAPGQPGDLTLFVAATTDVHGHLVGWDYYGNRADSSRGLSRAATIVDSLRAAAPGRVVLVDAGDMLQGTPLTYVAARRDTFQVHPVIAAMNAMQYDAAAVGNHEFNYGLPLLATWIHQMKAPVLGANAVSAKTGRPAYLPFVIKTMNVKGDKPVKVGVLGLTNPGVAIWDKANVEGKLRFTDLV